MSDYSDEELFDMSNEELEQAYKNLDKSDEEVSDEQVQEEEEDSTEEVAKSSEEVVEEDNSLDEPEEEIEEQQVSSELYKIRANGEDYELTLDELKKLAPKALNYTKKTQAIAPYRRMIGAMEKNGISQDDINLLIDMKKGNKEALSSFIKTMEVDPFDLPEETNYEIPDYGEDPVNDELASVIEELKQDNDSFTKVGNIISSLDNNTIDVFQNNPQMLRLLQQDVQSGVYDAIAPQINKLRALDGNKRPYLEYYALAGQQYLQNQERIQQSKKVKEESIKANKKVAGIPSSSSGGNTKKVINSPADIEYDDFMQWCREVENER